MIVNKAPSLWNKAGTIGNHTHLRKFLAFYPTHLTTTITSRNTCNTATPTNHEVHTHHREPDGNHHIQYGSGTCCSLPTYTTTLPMLPSHLLQAELRRRSVQERLRRH